MADNARALQKELRGTDKVVAFVGAMVPLSMHSQHPSDGIDALRFTLENIASQPPGVYVTGWDARNNALGFHDPGEVDKDPSPSLENLRFTVTSRAAAQNSR